MINTTFYDCAGSYLNRIPTVVTVNNARKERRVEGVKPVHTGKQFNKNSGTKANFASHIDICI